MDLSSVRFWKVTPLAPPLAPLLARPLARPLDHLLVRRLVRLLATPRPRPYHPRRKASTIGPPISPPLFSLVVCEVLTMLMTNLTPK